MAATARRHLHPKPVVRKRFRVGRCLCDRPSESRTSATQSTAAPRWRERTVQRLSQIQTMHDGFDDAGGDELVDPHRPEHRRADERRIYQTRLLAPGRRSSSRRDPGSQRPTCSRRRPWRSGTPAAQSVPWVDRRTTPGRVRVRKSTLRTAVCRSCSSRSRDDRPVPGRSSAAPGPRGRAASGSTTDRCAVIPTPAPRNRVLRKRSQRLDVSRHARRALRYAVGVVASCLRMTVARCWELANPHWWAMSVMLR